MPDADLPEQIMRLARQMLSRECDQPLPPTSAPGVFYVMPTPDGPRIYLNDGDVRVTITRNPEQPTEGSSVIPFAP